MLRDILLMRFGENSVSDFLLALTVFVVIFFGLVLFKYAIMLRLKKIAKETQSKIDNVILSLTEEIKTPVCAAVALYFSAETLVVPDLVHNIIGAIALVAVTYEGLRFIERLLDFFISRKVVVKDGEEDHLRSLFHLLIRIVLWVMTALLIFSNLGLDVTSLIASLGIGGIAIALAAQNILGDLFSAISIYFDKPFRVGDFIVLGEHKGVVKKIGLKTTRIQALGGEELIIPNAELTGSRVQNFGRLKRRRATFTFGVTYDTSVNKLRGIPDHIRSLIEGQPNLDFDRVTFKEFGDSSLNFEVIYFVNSNDYLVYANAQQELNFLILEVFAKEGIDMAFPTRTVHLVQ